MHKEALDFVKNTIDAIPPRAGVVEFGSRDFTNISVRPLFADVTVYIGVDLIPGQGVDVVADAAKFTTDTCIDTVVSTSTLQHVRNIDQVLANAHKLLSSNGVAIFTTVCEPWPTQGVAGGSVGDEFFRHVPAVLLKKALDAAGFKAVKIEQTKDGDVFAVAWKVQAEGPKERVQAMVAIQAEMQAVPVKARIKRLGAAVAYQSAQCEVCQRALYRYDGPVCPECFKLAT